MSAVTADTNNHICTACYDPAGNMTNYGGVTYTYDDENRLTSADGAFYYYDGDGNRVAKCNVNNCLKTRRSVIRLVFGNRLRSTKTTFAKATTL